MIHTAKIVAVGGGAIGELPTIDEFIVSLTEKERPRFLFLPTASGDSGHYINTARRIFKRLGCETDVLCLIRSSYPCSELSERISAADIIYAGGGNTVRMLDVWRRCGLPELLTAAGNRGAVLCGVSAGAMCWFSYGYSDCDFYDPAIEHPSYRMLKGLDLIPAVCCPHYDEPGRERFDTDSASFSLPGIALGNGTALAALGDTFRIIRTTPSSKAFLFTQSTGNTAKHELGSGDFSLRIQ